LRFNGGCWFRFYDEQINDRNIALLVKCSMYYICYHMLSYVDIFSTYAVHRTEALSKLVHYPVVQLCGHDRRSDNVPRPILHSNGMAQLSLHGQQMKAPNLTVYT